MPNQQWTSWRFWIHRITIYSTMLCMVFGHMTPVVADDKFGGFFKALKRGLRNLDEKYHERNEPNACTHPRVEELAGQIDWLEHHLEVYGSVIPKQPDIWGEARLTRHRQEVEDQLAKQLSEFGETLQGALSRSDKSSLSFMLALGQVVGGDTTPTTNITNTTASASTGGETPQSQASSTPGFPTASSIETKLATDGIQLEPTIHNDQLFRYLNALNTLRRLNEGDDTADAPGYALNLIRIPTSILPGRRTRQGYGAEITHTIRPYLGEELLPNTFRDLAIQDQVDQLSLHIKRLLEDPDLSDGVGPLAPLDAYIKAERSAQPIIDVFNARLDRLRLQVQSPDGIAYYHFMNGRREYLRNRIIQLEAAWRFSQVFGPISDVENTNLVDYRLGSINLLGQEVLFEAQVQVGHVRNALYRLLQTGLAIVPAKVSAQYSDTAEPLSATLHFVLCEKDLTKGLPVKDDLPYDVFLPTMPYKPGKPWQHESWLSQNAEMREKTGPRLLDWARYREEIRQEVGVYAAKNRLTLVAAVAEMSSAIVGNSADKLGLIDIDVERIASQAAGTLRLLRIDGEGLQGFLRSIESAASAATLASRAKSIQGTIDELKLDEAVLEVIQPELANLDSLRSELARSMLLASPAGGKSQESTNLVDMLENVRVDMEGVNAELLKPKMEGLLKADPSMKQLQVQIESIQPLLEGLEVERIKEVLQNSSELFQPIMRLNSEQASAIQSLLPYLIPIAEKLEQLSRTGPGLVSTYERPLKPAKSAGNTNEKNGAALPSQFRLTSGAVRAAQPIRYSGQESSTAMPPMASAEPVPAGVVVPELSISEMFGPGVPVPGGHVPEVERELPLSYSGQFSVHAQSVVADFIGSGIVFSAPSRTRGAAHPIPPSVVMDAYGYETILEIALLVNSILKRSPANATNDKLLEDVRRILQDELAATYEFLSQAELMHCWQFAGPELLKAIRQRDAEAMRRIRLAFLNSLPEGIAKSSIGALGWALILESALLNARLIDDMKDLADAKGCACGHVEGYCFWGPTPPVESRQAFNEYVQCKWPIQIFTVDPASQDQNIADSFSVTRELQIAAAVAAATGEVSLSTAADFARQVQVDIDTVAINKTAVGFSHANDTFGWRYYPRLQSPGTTGLVGTIGQTIMGGPGRDAIVRQRQMESGMRESVAIVVMPSFIPYVTVESRTSWFHLNDPADKELTTKDAMRLSSAQHSIENFMQCTDNCGCYRPGDVAHLRTVLDQLSKRLPFQHSMVQVPFENTVGGHELFRSGVAGLAPQLTGWYGAPGVDPNSSTSLFLTGRGFNVHDTRVIVGGRPASFRLLSRSNMEVTVPPGAQVLGGVDGKDNRIDIHVATPYGESLHLLVPRIESTAKAVSAHFQPGAMQLTGQRTGKNTSDIQVVNVTPNPAQPFGVYVPMSSLGASGKITLKLAIQTPAGFVPVGTDLSLEGAVYDSSSSSYRISAAGVGTILSTIQAQAQAFFRSGGIPLDSARIIFVATGSVEVNSVAHPISGMMPISLELSR